MDSAILSFLSLGTSLLPSVYLSFLSCRHLICFRGRLLAQECFSALPICLMASKTSTCLKRCSFAPSSLSGCSSVAASSSATLRIFTLALHTSRCSRYAQLHLSNMFHHFYSHVFDTADLINRRLSRRSRSFSSRGLAR